jgi:hypothetical protein
MTASVSHCTSFQHTSHSVGDRQKIIHRHFIYYIYFLIYNGERSSANLAFSSIEAPRLDREQVTFRCASGFRRRMVQRKAHIIGDAAINRGDDHGCPQNSDPDRSF